MRKLEGSYKKISSLQGVVLGFGVGVTTSDCKFTKGNYGESRDS